MEITKSLNTMPLWVIAGSVIFLPQLVLLPLGFQSVHEKAQKVAQCKQLGGELLDGRCFENLKEIKISH